MTEPERDAPDLEDLAAYLDGRLSGERRTRVEERLLRDEDYHEVFLESVQSLHEHGQAEEVGGEVVEPAVWWRSRRVATIAPLAAAATLVAVIGGPRLMLGPTTSTWVAQLNEQAVVDSGEQWDDPGWRRSRGGPDPDRLEREQRAFRIGTHSVDLQVALAAEARIAAMRAATQLETLISEDLLLLSGAYANLRGKIDGGDLDALKVRAAELEEYLEEGFEDTAGDRYLLGRWNEAGRLAALAGDAEVLTGIWRRWRVARGIDQIAPQLEQLEAVVEQPDPDFEAAEEAFSGIARALAGRG